MRTFSHFFLTLPQYVPQERMNIIMNWVWDTFKRNNLRRNIEAQILMEAVWTSFSCKLIRNKFANSYIVKMAHQS